MHVIFDIHVLLSLNCSRIINVKMPAVLRAQVAMSCRVMAAPRDGIFFPGLFNYFALLLSL